jgi:hypothetical protein
MNQFRCAIAGQSCDCVGCRRSSFRHESFPRLLFLFDLLGAQFKVFGLDVGVRPVMGVMVFHA